MSFNLAGDRGIAGIGGYDGGGFRFGILDFPAKPAKYAGLCAPDIGD